VPSSQEVLAAPPPRRRPALRALVTVLVLGLGVWGAVVKLSGDEPVTPAVAPLAPAGSSSSSAPARPVAIPPPPWVRYPSALEGRWVGVGAPGRLTLVISNSRLTLFVGTQRRPENRTLGFRTIAVSGHRVHIRPSADRGETATYRWRIRRDRLSFELLGATSKAALRLDSVAFSRA
jgi:hypothetical protein